MVACVSEINSTVLLEGSIVSVMDEGIPVLLLCGLLRHNCLQCENHNVNAVYYIISVILIMCIHVGVITAIVKSECYRESCPTTIEVTEVHEQSKGGTKQLHTSEHG